MKSIKKISLRSLAQSELKERQAKDLRGGYVLPTVCVTNCRCQYIGTQDPNNPLRGLMDTANGKMTLSEDVREF